MSEFLPIYYSGFWDVPHAFLTVYEDKLYYFERGYFDDKLDDYPANYKIHLVRNLNIKDCFEPYDPPIEYVKFINIDLLKNEVVGEIPTRNVIFDETKRKFVNSKVFENLSIE